MLSRLAALTGLILFRTLLIPSNSKEIVGISGYFCLSLGMLDICSFGNIQDNMITIAFAFLSLEMADGPVGVFLVRG